MKQAFLKRSIRGKTGRFVRELRRRHNDQCFKIVTYHSVNSQENVFNRDGHLCCHPKLFERQIDYLVAHYNVMSLRCLIEKKRSRESVQRAAVITFDDGFADTIRVAMPILFRRRLPMHIFPVAGVIGNIDLAWQHKAAWLISEGHSQKMVDAMRSAAYSPISAGEDVAQYVRRCFDSSLNSLLEEVLRSVGQSGAGLAGAIRPYIEIEDVESADPDLVEFGNHTMDHSILSALNEQDQHREISQGRERIKELTGYSPISFAYPFGLRQHFEAKTTEIVQQTGHQAALDMRRRINAAGSELLNLSRHPASNESLESFESMMEDFPINAASSAGIPS